MSGTCADCRHWQRDELLPTIVAAEDGRGWAHRPCGAVRWANLFERNAHTLTEIKAAPMISAGDVGEDRQLATLPTHSCGAFEARDGVDVRTRVTLRPIADDTRRASEQAGQYAKVFLLNNPVLERDVDGAELLNAIGVLLDIFASPRGGS